MKVQLRSRILAVFVTALAGAVAFAQTLVLTPNTTLLSSGGGNVTFTAAISYSTPPSTLSFDVILPSGWQYLSGTSVPGTSPAEPFVTPSAGHTGLLSWAFVTPPASGATFTFTATYPAGTLGVQSLSSSLVTRDGSGGTPTTVAGSAVSFPAATSSIAWNGGIGSWTDPTQWTPDTVPANAGGARFSATVAGGIATLNSPVTIDNLFFTGGTINGGGNLTVAGPASSWTTGVFSGLGELVIAPGATLTASGNAPHTFAERTIRNEGTFLWVDRGALQASGGGQFVNASGATFIDATTGVLDYFVRRTPDSTGAFTFTNAGTFTKSTSSSTRIEIPFANSGNVLVGAGTLRFTDSFTQSGGILFVASGATARFDNGLNFAAGTLHGSGNVIANVSNSGTLSPGNVVGTLTIDGNLTLQTTSQLLFDLHGPGQGTGYDFLNVTGTATLGGTFKFFVPQGAETLFSGTDTLTLLTASSLTGTFAGMPNGTRLFASHGTGSFVINYSGTSVTLNQLLPIPEPSTWALMITGLGVVAFATLRRRK